VPKRRLVRSEGVAERRAPLTSLAGAAEAVAGLLAAPDPPATAVGFFRRRHDALRETGTAQAAASFCPAAIAMLPGAAWRP